jgi:hypothetical protein
MNPRHPTSPRPGKTGFHVFGADTNLVPRSLLGRRHFFSCLRRASASALTSTSGPFPLVSTCSNKCERASTITQGKVRDSLDCDNKGPDSTCAHALILCRSMFQKTEKCVLRPFYAEDVKEQRRQMDRARFSDALLSLRDCVTNIEDISIKFKY